VVIREERDSLAVVLMWVIRVSLVGFTISFMIIAGILPVVFAGDQLSLNWSIVVGVVLGCTFAVVMSASMTYIAKRLIKAIQPAANVTVNDARILALQIKV
jgi:hypothetical protein